MKLAQRARPTSQSTHPARTPQVRRGLVLVTRTFKETGAAQGAVVPSMVDVSLGTPMKHLNQLEAISAMSTVVADTGETALVQKYRPQDCTTNPR